MPEITDKEIKRSAYILYENVPAFQIFALVRLLARRMEYDEIKALDHSYQLFIELQDEFVKQTAVEKAKP